MNSIINEYSSPFLISQLFKTFIRPILLYGNEVLDFKRSEINDIKRTEGNIIKKLLNIPIRSRTTWLFNALNIEPIDMYLENQKLNFINRLIDNKFTCKLIKYDIKKGRINKLWIHTNLDYLSTCENIQELKMTCSYAQHVNNTDLKYIKKNCNKTKEVRSILHGERKHLNIRLRSLLNYEKYI